MHWQFNHTSILFSFAIAAGDVTAIQIQLSNIHIGFNTVEILSPWISAVKISLLWKIHNTTVSLIN